MLEKKTISQCISVDCCKGWNDAINEIPKWINVKEGLPNHSGDYLVITRASNRVRAIESAYSLRYAYIVLSLPSTV